MNYVLGYKLIIPVISILSGSVIALLILYLTKAFGENADTILSLIFLGIELLVLIFVMIGVLILSMKYSGSPCKSTQHKHNIHYIRLVIIVWTFVKTVYIYIYILCI